MPLEADRPVDFGLQDFCRACKKCAVECPAQAISHDDEKTVYNGMRIRANVLQLWYNSSFA
jgi:epoxyqueuosine reductase QueG